MTNTESPIQRFARTIKETGFLDMMYNLRGRWEDERHYEDFADYVTAANKALPVGIKLIKFPKSFKTLVEFEGQKYQLDILLSKWRIKKVV